MVRSPNFIKQIDFVRCWQCAAPITPHRQTFVLQCSHTFCRECLSRSRQSTTSIRIKCPYCDRIGGFVQLSAELTPRIRRRFQTIRYNQDFLRINKFQRDQRSLCNNLLMRQIQKRKIRNNQLREKIARIKKKMAESKESKMIDYLLKFGVSNRKIEQLLLNPIEQIKAMRPKELFPDFKPSYTFATSQGIPRIDPESPVPLLHQLHRRHCMMSTPERKHH